MGVFDGGLMFDVNASIDAATCELDLPWYLDLSLPEPGVSTGVDAANNEYVRHYYDLPEIWEYTCVEVVASEESAKLYIGDSKGCDMLHMELPEIAWND